MQRALNMAPQDVPEAFKEPIPLLWKDEKINGCANSLPFPSPSLIHILVKGKCEKC